MPQDTTRIPCPECCRWALAAGLALLAFGCGTKPETDYRALKLAEVTGAVTLDGKPLPDARVIFESADGRYSFAKTDSSGEYRLMLNTEKSGVTPGKKTIRIFTIGGGPEFGGEEGGVDDGGTDEGDPDQARPPGQEGQEILPPRYHRDSELTRVVKDGAQTFDFDLISGAD